MPSYRYLREIKPEDEVPEPLKVYTKKEKARNWWAYHWYWVLAAVLLVGLVAFFVRDVLSKTDPDYKIGLVAPYAPPEVLTTRMQDELAGLLDDKNGDGEVVVMLEVFTITPEEIASAGSGADSVRAEDASALPVAGATDPYSQMAGVVRLSSAFEAGDPMIFMCDPAYMELYQEIYGIFGAADGTVAPEGVLAEKLTVAFRDTAMLATFDLQVEMYGGEMLDGQEYFAEYRVGMRAFYGTGLENKKDGAARWEEQRGLFGRLVG